MMFNLHGGFYRIKIRATNTEGKQIEYWTFAMLVVDEFWMFGDTKFTRWDDPRIIEINDSPLNPDPQYAIEIRNQK